MENKYSKLSKSLANDRYKRFYFSHSNTNLTKFPISSKKIDFCFILRFVCSINLYLDVFVVVVKSPICLLIVLFNIVMLTTT
jgi:hypothetical protein